MAVSASPSFELTLSKEIVTGSAKAQITLITYTDFDCPACLKHEETMKNLLTSYNGKVNWVYRAFPLSFHVNAEKKAVAAQCVATIAGNEAFWKYKDALFSKAYGRRTFSTQYAISLARPLKVNVAKLRTCLRSRQALTQVRNSYENAVKQEIPGIPTTIVFDHRTNKTFIVNGAILSKRLSYIIDLLLAGRESEIDPPSFNNPFAFPEPVNTNEHIRGSADANLVLIEYSEMECPFCKRHHPMIQELLKKYPGRLQWVYRNFPVSFQPKAMPGAIGAYCAGSVGGADSYWKYIDAAFADKHWTPESAAKAAGMAAEPSFKECQQNPTTKALIEAQIAERTKADVLTPPVTYVMNKKTGEVIIFLGPSPIEAFIEVIESKLQ